MQETEERQVWSLGQEEPLEEGMATHSSILAWRTPWTEDPGGLQTLGSQRVGHVGSNLAHTQRHEQKLVTGIKEWPTGEEGNIKS